MGKQMAGHLNYGKISHSIPVKELGGQKGAYGKGGPMQKGKPTGKGGGTANATSYGKGK